MSLWFWWALIFVPTWWVLMGRGVYAKVRAMASPFHRLTPAGADEWVKSLPDMPELTAQAERMGFRPIGCYTIGIKNVSTFIAVWGHQTRPTFFIAYHMAVSTLFATITKRNYDFVTSFSGEVTLTTGTSKQVPFFPPQPNEYSQAFSNLDLDEVWKKHQEGEGYLVRVGRVQATPTYPPFEEFFHEGVRRLTTFVQSLRLGMLRAPYWYLVSRRRWHNKSIEEQHRHGRIKMPDSVICAPATVVTHVPLALPVEPMPAAMGQVSEDLSCLKCGYNLRGLDFSGRCPECGTPIGRSTYGNALQFCDPAWVRQLASGAKWILWGNLYVLFAAFMAHVALMGGLGFRSEGWMVILPGLIWLVGCWKLTAPDPAEEAPGSISARSVTRWTAVASQLVIPMGALAEKRFPQFSSLSWAAWWSGALVAMLSLLHHVRQLASRIPRKGLSRQLQIIAWGIGIFGILELLAYAVHLAKTGMLMAASAATQPTPPDIEGLLATAFVCSAGVDLLILRLWWIVLAFPLWRSLRRAAQAADHFWNTESVPICARPVVVDERQLPPSEKVPFDSSGRVAADLACVRCGFNLRDLEPYSACPRCTAAVGLSTHGGLLRFANPEWVRRLASGAGWAAVGTPCYVAGGMVAAWMHKGLLGEWSHAVAQMLVMLVGLLGCWKLTAPEPDVSPGQDRVWARILARWMAVLAVAMCPIETLLEKSPGPYKFLSEGISGAILTVGTFVFFAYIGQILVRIPNLRLVSRNRLVKWGASLALLFLTAWSVVYDPSAGDSSTSMPAAGPQPPVSELLLEYGPPCLILPIGFVFFLLAVFLLLETHKAFREAADIATTTWAMRPAQPPATSAVDP